MVASSSCLGKCYASLIKEANPFGWFSGDDQRTDFICQWGFKEDIRHKCLSILFFRTEGFLFQEWRVKASLTKFVELQGYCYPNLVKGEDQFLLNVEDVYLLYALQTGIKTYWSSVICDYMIKFAKQKEYHLPYAVFISMILRIQNVDITNEMMICCNKRNNLEKMFLNSIGLRKSKDGWLFKDEYISSTDEVKPMNVDTSRYEFRPQIRFKEFVDERCKRLDKKMAMLQRSFTELRRKMDYALRINAFGDTSVDDSESEKNSADKKIMESSETE
ncbi:hypothetical protein LR48_Vigan08g085900 [Vigna angularis]|uniref:Uncharacterized protein n=1 Tax=Phaseolus angularis TaxID=3914 RepID=A0A0L9V516_PHAAN|nr:hypothetical protein LR48_Vigan08g085900 [Vigna angularis]